MSDIAVIANTAAAIIGVVVLIVRFKFNPVISLIVGSAYLGLAVGLGPEKTIDAITGGFGEIMAKVGLLIAFGVLMGAMLQQTGAIQRLVETPLRIFGPKRMPYALSLTIATLLQSIFLDVLLVISAPLGRALAKKVGKNGTARMATAMAIGLECGIVLTVPGVGALALAGLLGVPLGKMLLFGRALGDSHRHDRGGDHVFPVQPRLVGRGPRRTGVPRRSSPRTAASAPTTASTRPPVARTGNSGGSAGGVATTTEAIVTRAQTPLILLFAPMLASLALIATGAVLDAVDIENPIVTFLSSPVIALLIGLIGTSFVGRHTVGRSGSTCDRHRIQGERADPHPRPASEVRWRRPSRPPALATSSVSTSPPTRGPATDGVGDRRGPAHRGRIGHHLRDHLGRHPGPRARRSRA